MPNEKFKFLKEYKEISDKIVYIKDKDFLGFDSESSICFEFNLWRLKDFGCSENFVYLNDDCFIGRPLKKSDFFYKDQEKIYPYIIYNLPVDFNQYDKINNYYNYLKSTNTKKKYYIFNLQRASTLMLCYQLLGKNIKMPSKKIRHFPHNALGYNLNDLKEIYDAVKKNYKFADDCFNAKSRTKNALQHQTFYSFYLLNKHNRKINDKISYVCTEISRAWNANYNYDLFCINHGENKKQLNFIKAKIKMESLFPQRTKYEKPDIPDGTYNISAKLDKDKFLGIKDGEKSDNSNLNLYQKNNSDAQKFEVKYDEKGFYTITAKCSNKNLGIETKGSKVNILQHKPDGKNNQRWYIVPDENGYFHIVSKTNLMSMNIVDKKAINGTNVNCTPINATNAQLFKFIPAV